MSAATKATANKKRPRTKPSGERRDDLMNAALTLFLANGVAPTTIEQITAGADVAKGTFYLHFASKEEVLAALRERFVRELLEGIETAISACPAHDWAGKLAAWGRAGINGYLDALPLHDIVFHEFHPHSRDEHADNSLVRHLAALLEAGTAAGAWRVDDARFTAVFFFSGFHGIVDDALVKEKRVNRSRLASKLEKLFLGGVGTGV